MATADLHGVRVCKEALIMWHLLFAYDCFLFFRACPKESDVKHNILCVDEVASSQTINLLKSEIFFNRNGPSDVCSNIINTMILSECLGTGKYLGVPSW